LKFCFIYKGLLTNTLTAAVETYTPGGNKTRIRIYKPSELHPFDEQ